MKKTTFKSADLEISILSNVHRCWLSMPPVAGFLEMFGINIFCKIIEHLLQPLQVIIIISIVIMAFQWYSLGL